MSDIPAQARDLLRHANAILVLTGAGVSARIGVPTFRGREGLWKEFRPEQLATPSAFARDPRVVWEWYDCDAAGCSPAAQTRAHRSCRARARGTASRPDRDAERRWPARDGRSRVATAAEPPTDRRLRCPSSYMDRCSERAAPNAARDARTSTPSTLRCWNRYRGATAAVHCSVQTSSGSAKRSTILCSPRRSRQPRRPTSASSWGRAPSCSPPRAWRS